MATQKIENSIFYYEKNFITISEPALWHLANAIPEDSDLIFLSKRQKDRWEFETGLVVLEKPPQHDDTGVISHFSKWHAVSFTSSIFSNLKLFYEEKAQRQKKKVYHLLNLIISDLSIPGISLEHFSEEVLRQITSDINRRHLLLDKNVSKSIFPKKNENFLLGTYGEVLEIIPIRYSDFFVLKTTAAFILVSTAQLWGLKNYVTSPLIEQLENSIYYFPFSETHDVTSLEANSIILQEQLGELLPYKSRLIFLHESSPQESKVLRISATKKTIALSGLKFGIFPDEERIKKHFLHCCFSKSHQSFVLFSNEKLFFNFKDLHEIFFGEKTYWLLNLAADLLEFNKVFSLETLKEIVMDINKYGLLSFPKICQDIFPKKYGYVDLNCYGKILQITCLPDSRFCLLKTARVFILISTAQLSKLETYARELSGKTFPPQMVPMEILRDLPERIETITRDRIKGSVFYLPTSTGGIHLEDTAIENNLLPLLPKRRTFMFFRAPSAENPEELKKLKREQNIDFKTTQVILETGREITKRVVDCYPLENETSFQVIFKKKPVDTFLDFGTALVGGQEPCRLLNFVPEKVIASREVSIPTKTLNEIVVLINDYRLLLDPKVNETIFARKFENISPGDFGFVKEIVSFSGYAFLLMSRENAVVIISNSQLLAIKDYQPNFEEDINREILIFEYMLQENPNLDDVFTGSAKKLVEASISCLYKLLDGKPLTAEEKHSIETAVRSRPRLGETEQELSVRCNNTTDHVCRIYRKYISKPDNPLLNREQTMDVASSADSVSQTLSFQF